MAVCMQCGQENPAGARFCNACATPLDGEPEQPREVRKTVTVLFCDVVGSTELGERFDPEVLRGLMARFYAAVRAPVERHGGTVEKVIGDALVAVFGIPAVHEDDALRALRAALEMRDAVRTLGDLQARIGVNTGDVLARDATPGESLVVGDAVNVAARLEQAAAPGEVLVGEATWALVGHAASGQRVAPITAKGKSQPLEAWRLEAVDPQAGGHRRRLDLPMIGRERELDLLRWALDRTTQGQRPHLVTVLGQPGIGKSRLVAEAPHLGVGLIVLTGHCRATTQSSSLEPLLEVVRGLGAEGDGLSTRVAELMPGDPDGPAVTACLARGSEAGAPDLGWAASRLLGAAAASGPLVVVLEDVHWADDLLLDAVEQLLARGRGQSLLVVCTARPELADRRPHWGAGSNTISIALERLDDAQTRRLLTNAGPVLAEDQAEQIVATAEGNPLFAEHLAALVGDHSASGLPRSIQVLLTARLEALPESELEVMGVAAVAGRDFPVAAVQALVGDSVDEQLEHLVQRELLEPTGPGRQQFGHALLQEAAYGLIPKARRAQLHVQLADWMVANGGGDALIGEHLQQAHRLRLELGLDDQRSAELAEQAGVRLAAAGRRADALGEPVRAKALLERARALLPESSAGYVAATIELAAAGWNLSTPAERLELLDTGAALAAERGLRALELRARILRLGAVPESSQFALSDEQVLAETDAAIGELEALPDLRALATALCGRAEVEGTLGRAADAMASGQRALEVLRAADEDAVWALAILVWAAIDSPLPVSQVEELLEELMTAFGMRPAARSELLQGQCILAVLRGRIDEAWALFEAAGELERDLGRNAVWMLAVQHGELLIHSGRYAEARQVFEAYVREAERRDLGSPAAVARCWLGLAEVRSGDTAAAIASTAGLLDIDLLSNRYEVYTRARLVLSEARLADGDATAAVELARQAAAMSATGDWVLLDGLAKLTLARALAAAGDARGAATQARAAAALYEAKESAVGLTEATALLATLEAAGN